MCVYTDPLRISGPAVIEFIAHKPNWDWSHCAAMMFRVFAIAIAAAVVLGADGAPAINLGPAPTCRVVTATYGDQACCESCAAPTLLDLNRWVTVVQTDVANHVGGTELEIDFDAGSGIDAVSNPVSINITTDTAFASTTSANIPCGACITAADCIANNGVVNTWHRLCRRKDAYIEFIDYVTDGDV